MYKYIAFFAFTGYLLFSCEQKERKTEADDSSVEMSQPSVEKVTRKIDVKAIPSEGTTYGYEIYVDGKKYIYQPNIPGVSGKKGFRDEATALKVGQAVAEKIERGVMPPSITIAELKDLDAI